MMELRFRKLITGKNVIYITVKNRDYIRTRQIEKILGECAGSFEIYTSEKGNPFSRLIDLRKRIRGIRFENYDVVIVGFLPQLIWGSVERRVSVRNKRYSGNKSMVADMFLSLYDTVVLDRKLVRKNGPVSALCKALDKRVLREADIVLTDTKADADFFAKEFRSDRQKMDVLYLEAAISNLEGVEGRKYQQSSNNHQLLKTENQKNEKHQLNAEHKHNSTQKQLGGSCENYTTNKTILYFGTGLPLQGTDVVAKAYQILHNQDENNRKLSTTEDAKHHSEKALKLIYIGGTDHMTKSQRDFIQGEGVEYHKWLLEDELLSKIGEADICLAGHFNIAIDKADRTIPGKAFIYEALHKKMILGDTRANHELFSQDEKHIFVDRGNAEALARCIRRSLQ